MNFFFSFDDDFVNFIRSKSGSLKLTETPGSKLKDGCTDYEDRVRIC